MNKKEFLTGRYWKAFFLKYDRHISSVALLFGFVVDNITLQRIDLAFENIVLFFYIILVSGSITLINLVDEKVLSLRALVRARSVAPYIMQYAFGGLFSGFFIFYSRSASLSASWPFLLFLVALLVGNEKFRDKYLRFNFQIGIFFITLFSFMIFYVPVVVGAMGAWIFILSGAVSLVLIGLFLYSLSHFIPKRISENKNTLYGSIGGIFFAMNILYFTNIIPPIPLSLKDSGVYHHVVRTSEGNYRALEEERRWYELLIPGHTLHIEAGETAYFFSAVFAPTRLNTEIAHKWYFYDLEKKEWVFRGNIPFAISGGRDSGYRGYSTKVSPQEGKWRVDITTKRNQIIGRVKFRVDYVDGSRGLILKEL